jgi:hypothetical protein
MEAVRQVYEKIPASIPPELRDRRVEVIILPLDQAEEPQETSQPVDEYGWPLGFFEETFGSCPDLPDREPQGEYEVRRELE